MPELQPQFAPISPFGVAVAFNTQPEREECIQELHPLERACLPLDVRAPRLLQFASGRAAARAATQLSGGRAGPVTRGEDGETIWPEGLVGSISHKGGWVAAAAASSDRYRGIGVDIEYGEEPLSEALYKEVCLPEELAWIDGGGIRSQRATRLRALFSAKESVFKALFPLGRVWLGYHDAELTWSAVRSSFTATLMRDAADDLPAGTSLEVPCLRSGPWIVSGVAVST